MALGDMIKKRRAELNMTLLDVAKKVNVSEATVQRWESGNIKNLRHERISMLADALECSPAYLMEWGIEEAPSLDLTSYGLEPMPAMRKLPLLGTIACGEPILAQDNIEAYINVPEGVRADFLLRCKGDSMVNARIKDGDIVFIRQQPQVENGEIAAVLIEDEATLKRVYYDGDTIILQPENPAYPPRSYSGSDLNDIRIIGKAVAFLSEVG